MISYHSNSIIHQHTDNTVNIRLKCCSILKLLKNMHCKPLLLYYQIVIKQSLKSSLWYFRALLTLQ